MKTKKVEVPKDFELLPERDNGHNIIRCTKMIKNERDGTTVQCGYTIRNCSNPKAHVCFPGESTTGDAQTLLTQEIACFVGTADLPLQIVEEKYFTNFLKNVLEIGRKYHTAPSETLLPKLNRHSVRDALIQEARKKKEAQLSIRRQENVCSLTIDAGTLYSKHFIDFVISSRINQPFLYKAVEKYFVTLNDYKNITENILIELIEKHHIQVTSIVTDNLYVQVAALAHWYPQSIINTSSNSKIRKLFFFSCLCHTTELIVDSADKNCPEMANISKIVQEMVNLARIPKIATILKVKCPLIAPTRWLSRIDCINFILAKKANLLEICKNVDKLSLSSLQVENVKKTITEDNFTKILDFASIIYPFHVLIKIFEKDKSRQLLAVPLFSCLEESLQKKLNIEKFSAYRNILIALLQQIDLRKRKNMHWELLCAAYALTYEGRIWLRKQIKKGNSSALALTDEELRFSEKLPELDYKPPSSYVENEETDFYMETMINNLENSLPITPENFEQLPVPQRDVLPPTHNSGVFKNITETLKEAAKRLGEDPGDIEETFADFIYLRNPQKYNKISKMYPETFWQYFVLIPKYKAIVNVAIPILTAKASEACVERYFSKQKLVLNYLRLQSKEDLVNARFLLKE